MERQQSGSAGNAAVGAGRRWDTGRELWTGDTVAQWLAPAPGSILGLGPVCVGSLLVLPPTLQKHAREAK